MRLPPAWAAGLNFVLFQAGWFACILGAAHGYAAAGTAFVLLIAAVHLASVPRPKQEARLLLAAVVMGLVVDTALLHSGSIRYTSGHFPGAAGAWIAPHWIVASWLLLATALNVTVRWMKGRYLLAAAFGAIGTPLSYVAGVGLGAGSFVDESRALVLIAIGWAFLMPALVWLSSRFDGVAPMTRTAHD